MAVPRPRKLRMVLVVQGTQGLPQHVAGIPALMGTGANCTQVYALRVTAMSVINQVIKLILLLADECVGEHPVPGANA